MKQDCEQCDGTGEIEETCEECGEGTIYLECEECQGTGKTEVEE